ncbi:unnamed protein product [Prunus armeniaca]
MTGPPSSSYPSQVSPSAVEISPENRREKLGFARNFAGFVLRRLAAIFGDQDLRSEPGMGVMLGSPQGSSRVPGNSGREKLHWRRNNGFDALVEEVSSFCDKHHIDVPNMDDAFVLPGRSRRNAPIKTNRHHYHVELFIYVIDEQLTELDDRFNEVNTELLICLACLSPNDSFVAFDKQKLLRLAQFYPQDFSDGDLLALEDQLELYIHYVCSSSDFFDLQGIGNLAKKMVETRMHRAFNYVYLLITLALVLPVATASVERAFSVMNIIKGLLRNKMGDQWLSDSLLVYVEKDVFDCIENEAIMLRFQNMKPRRGQL